MLKFQKQIHWENATARAIILESVYWFYFTCISKWRLIISASLGVFNEILMYMYSLGIVLKMKLLLKYLHNYNHNINIIYTTFQKWKQK